MAFFLDELDIFFVRAFTRPDTRPLIKKKCQAQNKCKANSAGATALHCKQKNVKLCRGVAGSVVA